MEVERFQQPTNHVCSCCGVHANSRAELLIHKWSKHDYQSNNTSVSSSQYSSSQFSCRLCGGQLTSYRRLVEHVKSHECPHCFTMCTSAEARREHVKNDCHLKKPAHRSSQSSQSSNNNYRNHRNSTNSQSILAEGRYQPNFLMNRRNLSHSSRTNIIPNLSGRTRLQPHKADNVLTEGLPVSTFPLQAEVYSHDNLSKSSIVPIHGRSVDEDVMNNLGGSDHFQALLKRKYADESASSNNSMSKNMRINDNFRGNDLHHHRRFVDQNSSYQYNQNQHMVKNSRYCREENFPRKDMRLMKDQYSNNHHDENFVEHLQPQMIQISPERQGHHQSQMHRHINRPYIVPSQSSSSSQHHRNGGYDRPIQKIDEWKNKQFSQIEERSKSPLTDETLPTEEVGEEVEDEEEESNTQEEAKNDDDDNKEESNEKQKPIPLETIENEEENKGTSSVPVEKDVTEPDNEEVEKEVNNEKE
ncbi:hypothetical protein SNEBB_008590 [Seison nebaliae]|nr:hypothetical protein SNEBB_008590 [Seison nebaliae]